MEIREAAVNKVALVFPGQGAQYVGMGKDLYELSPAAREVFTQADEALGFSLTRLCFEGPSDALEDTLNTQPAILTTSIACLAAMRERLESIGARLTPRFVAGHSLGEYSALVAAGSLNFTDAVRLVRERGRLMKESGQERPGGMAAILGLDEAKVAEACAKAREKGIVAPANYNCPGQMVISGEIGALVEATNLAVQMGARKAIRLAISIASHSPLMQRASEQLAEAVGRFRLADAQVPVVANISAQVITTCEDIRRELNEQICRAVQWAQSVQRMLEDGTSVFIEVGPGQSLSGLIKRVGRGAEVMSVSDAASLEKLVRRLG